MCQLLKRTAGVLVSYAVEQHRQDVLVMVNEVELYSRRRSLAFASVATNAFDGRFVRPWGMQVIANGDGSDQVSPAMFWRLSDMNVTRANCLAISGSVRQKLLVSSSPRVGCPSHVKDFGVYGSVDSQGYQSRGIDL
jgi:hypothetical protein